MKLIRPRVLAGTVAWAVWVLAVSLAMPAQAQTYDPNYPICLQVYQSMVDYYFDCSYMTMAQCAASASGRSANCLFNPYYANPAAEPARRHKRFRKH
ncbi:MAG TPA: DUF3551 domain-containing protein [Bradyrhizobium sp.]|nr:DUF3551 domain-containing protein [Bradyrhizobium sp.]